MEGWIFLCKWGLFIRILSKQVGARSMRNLTMRADLYKAVWICGPTFGVGYRPEVGLWLWVGLTLSQVEAVI